MRRLNTAKYQEVASLMLRGVIPQVEVQQSTVAKDAGFGVFAKVDIPQNVGVCLYPGRYTPPIPQVTAIEYSLIGKAPIVYKESDLEKNAYVMNLPDTGGYIDATTHLEIDWETNPLAVGHLINHACKTSHNVEVIPFKWRDVPKCVDEALHYFPLPNIPRSDKSPWYFCPIKQQVVFHDLEMGTSPMYDANDERVSSQPDLSLSIHEIHKFEDLSGALIITEKPIKSGEELLLNYELNEPLPEWAEEWYAPSI